MTTNDWVLLCILIGLGCAAISGIITYYIMKCIDKCNHNFEKISSWGSSVAYMCTKCGKVKKVSL